MVDEKYEKMEQEYKKELTEFFRKRLKFTYYEIYKKSNYKCRQQSIPRIVENRNFLSSVKTCITKHRNGLMDLAKYGKDVIDLSFEAIIYHNKDYQELYDEEDLKEILAVCEFALKEAYKEAERLQAKNKKLTK